MVLKCTECGNLLKKELIKDDQVICPICDSQYKVVSTPDGKQHLEQFSFGGNDPGEL